MSGMWTYPTRPVAAVVDLGPVRLDPVAVAQRELVAERHHRYRTGLAPASLHRQQHRPAGPVDQPLVRHGPIESDSIDPHEPVALGDV